MKLHRFYLSQQAKDQLVKLKRVTGIKHWNVLCRWAFCISLAEPSDPPMAHIPADSTVEMTWHTFAGNYHDIYMALLKQRCVEAGLVLTAEVLLEQLRLHIHRGIGYLFADRGIKNIEGLVARTLSL